MTKLIKPRNKKTNQSILFENGFVGQNVSIGHGTIISPGAVIGSNTIIGKNNYIGIDAIIAPSSIIGDNNCINTSKFFLNNISIHVGNNCIIMGRFHAGFAQILNEDVVKIGDNVHISQFTNIANSTIGDNCFIGINCSIRNSKLGCCVSVDNSLIKSSRFASDTIVVESNLENVQLGKNYICHKSNIKDREFHDARNQKLILFK